jgi:thioredoxin-like negative regulator of GroEL
MEKSSKSVQTLSDVKFGYAEACWFLDDVHEAEKMLQSIPELSRTDRVWALLAKVYERMGNSKYGFFF